MTMSKKMMADELSYLINLPADTGSVTKQASRITAANSFLVIAILIIVEFN
jgi:hypothetical protein